MSSELNKFPGPINTSSGQPEVVRDGTEEAATAAEAITFLDSYDLATGKLTLRSATHFPMEIFDFARQFPVEILNASGSKLSVLPQEFGQLDKLRIAFWSENALPPSIRWLMLTDNLISKIPASIGKLTNLQKLALTGNRIESLPKEMASCLELELLRVSANNFKSAPPAWLWNHPRLSWYADSGNPFCMSDSPPEIELLDIALNDATFSENNLIGESPSSRVYAGTLRVTGEAVAIKIFKRGLTSDGFPEDDMRASIAAGTHRGLIKIIGKLSGHPQNSEGIVMTLVPSDYKKLGHPPDFKTCTRDTFPVENASASTEKTFSIPYILNVLKDISSACKHLHARGISHGDIYAHNTLSNALGRSLLGDFGAGTFYDKKDGDREPLDVRAFGCLIEDLLERCEKSHDESIIAEFRKLQQACKDTEVSNRPTFGQIFEMLSKIQDIKN